LVCRALRLVIGRPWRAWSISIRIGCVPRQRRTKEDPPERVDTFRFPLDRCFY
jgi:hypothetical protein